MVTEITDKSFEDVINESNLIFVLFYSNNCSICGEFKIIYDDVSNAYPNYKFYKLNIDKNSKVAEKLDLEGVPTTVVFYEGNIINMLEGHQSPFKLRSSIYAMKMKHRI